MRSNTAPKVAASGQKAVRTSGRQGRERRPCDRSEAKPESTRSPFRRGAVIIAF